MDTVDTMDTMDRVDLVERAQILALVPLAVALKARLDRENAASVTSDHLDL